MNEQQLDFDDVFDVWSCAWWEQPWIWFGIACGSLLIVTVFYAIIKKYWSGTRVLDPREQALKRLYAINPAVGITSQEEYKFFYAELLVIVKEYLDSRYGYKSSGKTDYELLAYLKVNGNVTVFPAVVKQLVEHGLTIKFARDYGKEDRVRDDYSFVLEAISEEPGRIKLK